MRLLMSREMDQQNLNMYRLFFQDSQSITRAKSYLRMLVMNKNGFLQIKEVILAR